MLKYLKRTQTTPKPQAEGVQSIDYENVDLVSVTTHIYT